MTDERKLMRYAFYALDPAWRQAPDEDRALHKKAFLDAVSSAPGVEVHTYSTVGLRADAELCLWSIADGPAEVQALQARINGSSLGRALRCTYSFLALTRKSQYLHGHVHERTAEAIVAGSPYLFVYPMDKQRRWYRLQFDERRRIMAEHFRIGHQYPTVHIHTGYSFGLDDQEFVVAFEADALGDFLDLVEELRGSESSSYTARDVPIFTCVRAPLAVILDQLDGTAA
jgi:chlorite dismutase